MQNRPAARACWMSRFAERLPAPVMAAPAVMPPPAMVPAPAVMVPPAPMAVPAVMVPPAAMVPPAHLGGELAGLILHRSRNARIDQRHRRGALGRRGKHERSADGEKAQNFFQVHVVP